MAHSGVPGQRVVSPALVGRAAELTLVASVVAAPPALVIIDGEAGIGKSRLVAELARLPEVTGRRLLVGRCYRIRESFPLGPLIEALRGLARELTEVTWSPVAGALRPLLPELAALLPPAPAPLDDRAAERHRVFRAMVEVLGSLGPTVLVLEDLHWADEQTIDFVGYLLAAGCPGLTVVLTMRGQEADPAIRALAATLPSGTTRAEVVLRPLDEAGTGALAAAIVGAEQVSDEFATYLCERTSGLPLAIEELLALLQARGKLVRRGGGWARRALDELDVPSGIRDPVIERVSRLSPPARAVAEAAAVLQLPVPLASLVATCRVGQAEAATAVEEALTSGLLSEQGEAIGFRHLLAAQAVYEEIPGPRRRELHGRAADVLSATEPVPLGQVSHHLRHAGRLDEWVGAAERAAEQALRLGHDGEAFRLLEQVLRNAPLDPDRRGRLAVRLGQAAIETLRAREVQDLLSEVLDTDLPPALRGELRLQVGLLLHDLGSDALRVRQLMTDAVAELDGRPDLRAWAMLVLGIPTAHSAAPGEHRQWLLRALDELPGIDDPVFEVFLLGKVAMVLAPMGDPRWRQLVDRIEQRTNGTPQHRREVNAFWSAGMQAGYAGDHDTGLRLLTAGLDGAIASGNRRMELNIRSALALLRYCRGQWGGLAEEASVLIAELAEYPRALVDVQIAAGSLALVNGDLDGAHRHLSAAVEQCLDLGGYDVFGIALPALLRLAAARDERAVAEAMVDKYLTATRSSWLWVTDTRALPWVVETLVWVGRAADAAAQVAHCAAQLAPLDAPLAPAALTFAEAVLQRAEGQHHRAAQLFTDAAGRYAALGCPYEAALATEQAANSQFAADRPAAGEAALQEALTAFRSLASEWDTRRVTGLARHHQLPVPARHRGGRRGYGNELSPREREVAELAATGRSNKEIAAELFLSVNTVGRHISAAMRKLGARSRTALAHRLSGRDDRAGTQ